MSFSPDVTAYYRTPLGAAYMGDARDLLEYLEPESVDLIVTSPPFALLRQKQYGNVPAAAYLDWFFQFVPGFRRVLKPAGSLVIDIGGTWQKGVPVRSLYHYELVLRLCRPESEEGGGFCLAQELYWYNPSKLPTPAEWVTVRRERVKDAVNTIWWLALGPHPKASNRRVLTPYSGAQQELMRKGYQARLRPSEHQISRKFGTDNGGAIPPNLISAANTASNDRYLTRCRAAGIAPHPARFPAALPEFVIGLCTEPGDLVLDPFAGSNCTGAVAEQLGRRWLAFELNEIYLEGSRLRFDSAAARDDTPCSLPPSTMP